MQAVMVGLGHGMSSASPGRAIFLYHRADLLSYLPMVVPASRLGEAAETYPQ